LTAPVASPTTATNSGFVGNLDATPLPIRNNFGASGGRLVRFVGTITPTPSQAVSVLNRLVRIPSNLIVHRVAVILNSPATTLTGNIGLWYSDNPNDGTALANVGNLTPISSAFFASALPLATYAYVPGTDPAATVGLPAPVDITFAASSLAFTDANYVPSQMVNPIWQAVSNLLALQTTPVGAFCLPTNGPQAHFNTPSAGGVVYVQSDDPGGFFDIGLQLTTAGSAANQKVTCIVDGVVAS
jgi:hypothetical protein